MNKRTYSFAVGVVMILASLAFFLLPVFFSLDAFVPLGFSLVSFLVGIGFFFMGHGE